MLSLKNLFGLSSADINKITPGDIKSEAVLWSLAGTIYTVWVLFLWPPARESFLSSQIYPVLGLLLWNLIIAVAALILAPAWSVVYLCISSALLFIFSYEMALSHDAFFILTYVLSWAACFWIPIRNKKLAQASELKREHLHEDINLLEEDLQRVSRLTPALQMQYSKFTLITEATEAINNSLELEKTLYLAVEIPLYTLEKGRQALLFMYDHHTVTLELKSKARRGEPGSVVKEKEGSAFDQWVAKHKQALIIQDTDKDFRFGNLSEDTRALGIKSLIAVPLLHKSNLLGVLRMDSDQAGAFLPDDLRILDIVANVTSLVIQNTLLFNKTKEMAIKDSLTGLFVHRYFHERLDAEWKRAHITQTPLSILIIDIDHFKHYNDTFGHMTGDRVLVWATKKIADALPRESVIGRYGGDEFSAILPRTEGAEAYRIAEALRENLASSEFDVRRTKTNITASIGIASYPENAGELIELVAAADKALYQAKKEGRNKVCRFLSSKS